MSSRLQTEVEELLRNTSRVDAKEIEVSVDGNTVVLKGAVDSAREKRYAREMAESVDGVEYVRDDMTVKNFTKRPDNELAEAVSNALMRDAFVADVASGIEVRASSGEIQLDGNVPTYIIRKAAEDVAWWTPGVINVENMLLVTDEEFVDVSPLEVV